ncbi:MAG: 4Fe-4S dicluster domain-containing protein, partial [Eggerthella lenta]
PESDVSKRIALGDAVRVDETSFYYVPMNGMDEDLLPTAAGGAFAESSKAAPGIDPVAATVGVVAVAAVGVGVGVGVKKSKDKAKAQAKTEAKSE